MAIFHLLVILSWGLKVSNRLPETICSPGQLIWGTWVSLWTNMAFLGAKARFFYDIIMLIMLIMLILIVLFHRLLLLLLIIIIIIVNNLTPNSKSKLGWSRARHR